MRTAEEYKRAIAPLQGRAFLGALLKFSVFDDTPHKVPRLTAGNGQSSQDTRTPGFGSASSGAKWDAFSKTPGLIPPPPIIFSTPPTAYVSPPSLHSLVSTPINALPQRSPIRSPMDIDVTSLGMMGTQTHKTQYSPSYYNPVRNVEPSNVRMSPAQFGGAQRHQNLPQQEQRGHNMSTSSSHVSSCCSVSQGKAEIETLLTSFRSDLDRIMNDTFAPSSSAAAAAPSSAPFTTTNQLGVPTVPGAWPEPTSQAPSPVASRDPSCLNNWCMVCGKLFNGPWFSCGKCTWHVLVR